MRTRKLFESLFSIARTRSAPFSRKISRSVPPVVKVSEAVEIRDVYYMLPRIGLFCVITVAVLAYVIGKTRSSAPNDVRVSSMRFVSQIVEKSIAFVVTRCSGAHAGFLSFRIFLSFVWRSRDQQFDLKQVLRISRWKGRRRSAKRWFVMGKHSHPLLLTELKMLQNISLLIH